MRRRMGLLMAILLCASLVLAACGKKDATGVVKDLDRTVAKMSSYHGMGTMTLNTGMEPQVYEVEVCYQAPDFYRIALTNDTKDITQIVLRNKDGVFVLTPHLKKSFRFQSDWPENQGQVYLFQTLAQSIVMDDKRQFATLKDAYVFDVEANYQNGSLSRQKIWLDKASYAPKHVEVSDENANVLVTVDFKTFEFNSKFDKDYFEMERNMTSYELKSLPASAHTPHQHGGAAQQPAAGAKADQPAANTTGDKTSADKNAVPAQPTTGTPASGSTAAKTEGQAKDQAKTPTAAQPQTPAQTPAATQGQAKATTPAQTPAQTPATTQGQAKTPTAAQPQTPAAAPANPTAQPAAAKKDDTFGLVLPKYMPSGVKQQDIADMKLGDRNAVLLRYSGTYNYTLMESRPQEKTVSAEFGKLVDLGFTLGVLTGDVQKTLHWTNDGMDFRLSSGDLPEKEMIRIAQSTAGLVSK